MPNAKLIYFADPLCSWCYGYSSVITRLAEKHPVQLVMGGLRGADTPPMTAGFREQIQSHWRKVQAATEQAGSPVEFDFDEGIPAGFVYNTEPACRAVVTAQSIDSTFALPLMKAIQIAFYAQAQGVTQASVLVRLAESVGLEHQSFSVRFDSDEMKTATREQFITAQQCGVTGFPALMLERDNEWHPVSMGYTPLSVTEAKIAALV